MEEQDQKQLRSLEDRIIVLEEEIKRLKKLVKTKSYKTEAEICQECLPPNLRI